MTDTTHLSDITQMTADLAAMCAAEAKKRLDEPLLPLGIHFGLDEHRYHRDPGIGSTDIRQLTRNPQAYWFYSWMNPRRPPDISTPSQIRGTALHRLVYLGQDYFERHYICGPDQAGMTTGEKSASTKRANALAAEQGKTMLKIDDYERVAICAAMIMQNPNLSTVFQNGHPEVSVFWEQRGVRCKARFDYLKVRGIGDLKSCANPFEINFPKACRNDIGRYAYAEQATWYMTARSQMRTFIERGMVYGSEYEPRWLNQVAIANEWAWQWVFYGIEGPPLTWSSVLSPANPYVEKATMANNAGLDNYLQCLQTFGTEQWLLIEEPQELTLEDMPLWALNP